MENRLVNGLVMTLILTVVAVPPRCMGASTLRLTLVIYDHAHVGSETLAAAENTVAEILGHANVQLIWRDGFAYAAERRAAGNLAPEDSATSVIKLQPESEAVRYGVRPACGGIGFESGAIVFVRSSDSRSATSAATRLGYVMTHELGHILLGPNAHAIVGIMRGTLLPGDWEKAAQGTLGFTHSQNQQIRTWIAGRGRSRRTFSRPSSARPSCTESQGLESSALPRLYVRPKASEEGVILNMATQAKTTDYTKCFHSLYRDMTLQPNRSFR